MRAENNPRTSRLLRVREFTEKVAKKPQKKAATSQKSRFVAPCYLSDDDRTAIVSLLEQADISDSEGRLLFITAAEYEVGTLKPSLQEAPPVHAPPLPKTQTKAEVELAQLGASAAQFLGMLRQTHKSARNKLGSLLTASDPFGRAHDDHYLAQLELEMARIVAVCKPEDPEEEVEPPPPPITESAKRLVTQLSRIFGECLDRRAYPETLETFSRVLCVIRDAAAIEFPCDPDKLGEILQETG
jgi:hypothetical protein